ncbi:MAG: dTDP-4-dehydrorhamnose 3,5-epimerase family protein, partial [Parasutterella sp.]
MQIIETPIQDLLEIQPKVFGDKRGFFLETWQKKRY